VAQANYSAAKGGIVSLVRSAAAGLYKYGVTANCVAPTAKSRMSGAVPFGFEMGEPEDVAPLVTFLVSDRARHLTGQIYSINGGEIGVYNQPVIVRTMKKTGAGRPRRSPSGSTRDRRRAAADPRHARHGWPPPRRRRSANPRSRKRRAAARAASRRRRSRKAVSGLARIVRSRIRTALRSSSR
jgi:hypothetical protein